MSLTHGKTHAKKRYLANKAALIALILLVAFGILGDVLLDFLGISHDAFRIAGGALLLLAAIEMVMAKPSGLRATTTAEDEEAEDRNDISVFPLAIPLIAGPGAITTAVMLMRSAEEISLMAQLGFVVITVLVVATTYTAMRLSEYLSRVLGVTGMNVMTRVFGIVLAGLATQNILSGLRNVFS